MTTPNIGDNVTYAQMTALPVGSKVLAGPLTTTKQDNGEWTGSGGKSGKTYTIKHDGKIYMDGSRIGIDVSVNRARLLSR